VLSDDLYARVGQAHLAAMRHGVPLADELDRQGLLLTPERLQGIREGVLNVLTAHVAAERPETLLRWHFGDSNPRTPAQVWDAVQAWLLRLFREERTR